MYDELNEIMNEHNSTMHKLMKWHEKNKDNEYFDTKSGKILRKNILMLIGDSALMNLGMILVMVDLKIKENNTENEKLIEENDLERELLKKIFESGTES